MILAEAVSGEEGAEILDRLVELKPEKGMVSPYMNHHFVEALLMCGKKDQAMEYMKYYWGGMISHGADTFWELYNPEKSCRISIWKQHCQQLLPRMELHSDLSSQKIF